MIDAEDEYKDGLIDLIQSWVLKVIWHVMKLVKYVDSNFRNDKLYASVLEGIQNIPDLLSLSKDMKLFISTYETVIDFEKSFRLISKSKECHPLVYFDFNSLENE